MPNTGYSIRQYTKDEIRELATPSRASTVIGWLPVILSAASFFAGKLRLIPKPLADDLAGWGAVAGLLLFAATRALLAPYWVAKRKHQAAEGLRGERDALEAVVNRSPDLLVISSKPRRFPDHVYCERVEITNRSSRHTVSVKVWLRIGELQFEHVSGGAHYWPPIKSLGPGDSFFGSASFNATPVAAESPIERMAVDIVDVTTGKTVRGEETECEMAEY